MVLKQCYTLMRNYRALKLVTRSYGALEKSEIAWFSNLVLRLGLILYGLEECEITWCSSPTPVENHECTGLEEDKITWYSNIRQLAN